jgi:hypothetical protein
MIIQVKGAFSMTRKLSRISVVLIVLAMILCQGCLPAAMVYGYKRSADAKEEQAKTQAMAADLAIYAQYRKDMEIINLQREQAGLKPNPILGQDEWRASQAATQSVPPSAPVTPAPPATTSTPPEAVKTD